MTRIHFTQVFPNKSERARTVLVNGPVSQARAEALLIHAFGFTSFFINKIEPL